MRNGNGSIPEITLLLLAFEIWNTQVATVAVTKKQLKKDRDILVFIVRFITRTIFAQI